MLRKLFLRPSLLGLVFFHLHALGLSSTRFDQERDPAVCCYHLLIAIRRTSRTFDKVLAVPMLVAISDHEQVVVLALEDSADPGNLGPRLP